MPMKKDDNAKKVVAVALVAAVAGIAIYAYVRKKKAEKRKYVPINFI